MLAAKLPDEEFEENRIALSDPFTRIWNGER
jgi:hypothetical protein